MGKEAEAALAWLSEWRFVVFSGSFFTLFWVRCTWCYATGHVVIGACGLCQGGHHLPSIGPCGLMDVCLCCCWPVH